MLGFAILPAISNGSAICTNWLNEKGIWDKKNYVQKWEIGREKIVEKRHIVSMMRKVSAKPTQLHRIDIDIGPDAHIFKLFGNERKNTEQPAITNV